MLTRLLSVLLLGLPLAVDAVQPPVRDLQDRSAVRVQLNPDEPIEAEALERMGVADRPQREPPLVDPGRTVEVVRPDINPNSAVTVDLATVRRWYGGQSEINLVAASGARSLSAQDEAVALSRGEWLVIEPEQSDLQPFEFNGVVNTPAEKLLYTVDQAGRKRELGLIHRATELHWRSPARQFHGTLLVGLLDLSDPTAGGSLDPDSIPVQLLAPPDTLNRTELALGRIGQPFEKVEVAVSHPDDPFAVDFVSASIDLGLPPARLPVKAPELDLSGPPRIMGLGVGEATVTLSGFNTELPPGEAVTMRLDNGWIDDPVLVVDETGTASARIRSVWLGSGTLEIAAPSMYQAAPLTIEFTLPVRFLVATVIGAVLGALVLVYLMKRRNTGRQSGFLVDWSFGLAIGVVATLMAYAGMQLPAYVPVPAALVGEIVPFCLAFICAATATRLIHAIGGSPD